jgi:hypothetical protein
MTVDTGLDLERSLLDHIEGQFNRADSKAQFTLTIESVLMASTSFFQTGAAKSIFDASTPFLGRIAACLFVLMFILLVIATIYSVAAIIPRLTQPKEMPVNIFYFGSIVSQSEQEFIRTFDDHAKNFREMLLSEIYTSSLIAYRKYKLVRQSYLFLITSLFVWAGAQLLVLFSK